MNRMRVFNDIQGRSILLLDKKVITQIKKKYRKISNYCLSLI